GSCKSYIGEVVQIPEKKKEVFSLAEPCLFPFAGAGPRRWAAFLCCWKGSSDLRLGFVPLLFLYGSHGVFRSGMGENPGGIVACDGSSNHRPSVSASLPVVAGDYLFGSLSFFGDRFERSIPV